MPSEIIYSQDAVLQLKKLDNEMVRQILERLDEAATNPHHFFKRLSGREDYKLRAGDYRVIAKILSKENTIFVLSLGHRKNIYKR